LVHITVNTHLHQETVTSHEKSKIHSIKPKKSSGYDEITRKVLKTSASPICHPLSYMYNHSLYTAWGKAMATYPQELAQDAACQSHTSRLTGLWFLPNRPKG